MKWVIWALLGILIAVGLFFVCARLQPETQQTETQQVAPDVSRYTADQVIYIARAQSPSCPLDKMTASWSARYLGEKKWVVSKVCTFQGQPYWAIYWYFHEDTSYLEFAEQKYY